MEPLEVDALDDLKEDDDLEDDDWDTLREDVTKLLEVEDMVVLVALTGTITIDPLAMSAPSGWVSVKAFVA